MTTWPMIAGAAGASLVSVWSYGAFHPRSRLFGPVIWHGSRSDPPRVALTFDDGPHPKATLAILDILSRHGVSAAFFVIGTHVQRYPDVLRQVDARGHMIGSHSYDHAYLGMFRRLGYWSDQLQRTEQAVQHVIGRRPRLFRPPMGFKQRFITSALRRRNEEMVTWSLRGLDGRPTTAQCIVERLVPPARGGDILTLHDGVDTHSRRDTAPTIEAIEPLIIGLKQRALKIERLDQLIDESAYHGSHQ